MRRFIWAIPVLVLCAAVAWAQDKDTKAAAAARQKLKQKVTVKFKDTLLKDVVEELQDQVMGLRFRLDTKGGVSMNRKITYMAKDKPLDEVLDEMFKKEGLGYIVISKEKDAYDGTIWIKQGKERGYPEGQEPKDK
jgi:type II secretory pathway component GspD/PulD (secretin)